MSQIRKENLHGNNNWILKQVLRLVQQKLFYPIDFKNKIKAFLRVGEIPGTTFNIIKVAKIGGRFGIIC